MPRFLCLLLALGLAACGDPAPPVPEDYVARVGGEVLTAGDLERALDVAPVGLDSVTARRQVIEQWVTAELMAREAEARGLREQPDVQRQLEENERAVLAAALLGSLYEEDATDPSQANLDTYFERNRERLRLREPFVRVRFIETATRGEAQDARRAMQQAMLSASPDSLWEAAARTFALDTTASLTLGRTYVPESRLLADQASAWQAIRQLSPGQISAVLETDTTFHVLQLIARAAAGSEPELAWIEDEVRQQVTLGVRKQMVARQVQRLRNEALSRGHLEIREPRPIAAPLSDSTRQAPEA
ncbi:MAG: peptidyl-prolyl cis-trans isomerase [Bacteroidota bacterium]